MLLYIGKLIKKTLYISIPENYKAEYSTEIDRANMSKVKIIAMTFLVMELIMLVIFTYVKGDYLYNKPNSYYMGMYVLIIITMLIFLMIFTVLEKNIPGHRKSIKAAGVSFTYFILLWCAGISLLDQLSYGQTIVYLTAIISIAVVPLFQPITFFLIYLTVQAVFVGLMPYFQKSGDIMFGNIINSTLFILLSLVIARIRYKTCLKDYINRQIIVEKSDEINKINEELKAANQKLEKLARTDSLTGVFNRSMFDILLSKEWNRCKRYSTPLSLFMIDIDFFKEYNDNYGHLAGDDCIRQIAKVLSSSAKRSSDCVVRFGGDEFSIISPHLEREPAFILAEHIRTKVSKLSIPHAYSPVSECVTISLGINTIIPSEESAIDEFVRTADKALYAAKRNRNKSFAM